jgi:hypothetical protein
MWGLSANIPRRMIPTNDNKWCVYWKPSIIDAFRTIKNKDGSVSPVGTSMDKS